MSKNQVQQKIHLNIKEIAEFRKQIEIIRAKYEGENIPKGILGDIQHMQSHIRNLEKENLRLKNFGEERVIKCLD